MLWVLGIINKCFYWLNYKDLVQTAFNSTISTISDNSQVPDNIRNDFSTSYYFEMILNYGSTETSVAMLSNSDIEFMMVE